jgi:hypothetical protein
MLPVIGDDAYLGFWSLGQELPGLTLLKDSSGVGYQSDENWTLPQGARNYEAAVYCTTDHSNTTCHYSSASEVPALSEMTFTLEENTPPAISSVNGGLATAAGSHSTISGTQELGFTGSDTDSGVLSAKLTIPTSGRQPDNAYLRLLRRMYLCVMERLPAQTNRQRLQLRYLRPERRNVHGRPCSH